MTVINDRSMQEEINDSLEDRLKYMKAELSGGFEYGSGGIDQQIERVKRILVDGQKEYDALVKTRKETVERITRIEIYLKEQSK